MLNADSTWLVLCLRAQALVVTCLPLFFGGAEVVTLLFIRWCEPWSRGLRVRLSVVYIEVSNRAGNLTNTVILLCRAAVRPDFNALTSGDHPRSTIHCRDAQNSDW